MNYGEIIKDAFWISWRNKYLWFFGFFVGGGSSFNFNIPSGGDFNGDDFDFEQSSVASSFAAQMGGLDGLSVALIGFMVVIFLVLVLVFIALALISSGGLAGSVAAIKRGESRRFGSTWRTGTSNMWRVLGQAILFILIALACMIVLALVVGLPFVAVFTLTESLGARIAAGILLGFLGLGLLLMVFLPLYIAGQFALRKLVVDGERVGSSIGSGFALLRANIGRSLLVWLMYLGISIGVGIAILIVFIILAIILLGPAIALFIGDYTTAAIAVGIVGGLIFLAPMLVISGAVGSFNHAYWTLAYLQLTASRAEDASVQRI